MSDLPEPVGPPPSRAPAQDRRTRDLRGRALGGVALLVVAGVSAASLLLGSGALDAAEPAVETPQRGGAGPLEQAQTREAGREPMILAAPSAPAAPTATPAGRIKPPSTKPRPPTAPTPTAVLKYKPPYTLTLGPTIPQGPAAAPPGDDRAGWALGAEPLLSPEQARARAAQERQGEARARLLRATRMSAWVAELEMVSESERRGSDISWPQCPGSHPEPEAHNAQALVVVGATHRTLFNPNKCLREEFGWALSRPRASLYFNVTHPSREAQERFGGAEAATRAGMRHAVRYAASQGAASPSIVLDVEASETWFESEPGLSANAIVVAAAIDELASGGYEVVMYGSQSSFGDITGGHLQTSIPSWVAIGSRGGKAGELERACGKRITDGPVLMVQYLVGRFDENRVCRAHEQRRSG